MKEKRKIILPIRLIIFLLIIGISLTIALYLPYHPKIQGKRLLEQYQWDISEDVGIGRETAVLSEEFLEADLTRQQIEASGIINIPPAALQGKNITIYNYTLKQTGIQQALRARIWFYKDNIICGYLLHSENNIRIRYWSLNTPYQTILSELKELMINNPAYP